MTERAAHCNAVGTRIPDMLRLLLALVLALNVIAASAMDAPGLAADDAAPSGHQGHDGMSGMDHGGGPTGPHDGNCCNDESSDGCDCSCALHQPAASRPALAISGHVNTVRPAIAVIERRPSNTTTTPFRPPA